MRRPIVSLVLVAGSTVALLLRLGLAAVADDSDDTYREMVAGGPWTPGPFVPCAPGVVTSVEPRLEVPHDTPPSGRFESGVAVAFDLASAPRFLNGQIFRFARVVHYQDSPGNAIMAAERRGDRVQVCLTGFPTPTHDPKTGSVYCDPNVDRRGLAFRVYDYRLRAAYAGPDSEHGCGGA